MSDNMMPELTLNPTEAAQEAVPELTLTPAEKGSRAGQGRREHALRAGEEGR